MQHEYTIENELSEVVYAMKSTLASINIKILTEEVTEKKLNTEVFNNMSKISNLKSILNSNSFREINKEGKYMFSYKLYDLDQFSSYIIFSLFKIDEDDILPKNGFDMLLSGLCIFSKRMELYLATFEAVSESHPETSCHMTSTTAFWLVCCITFSSFEVHPITKNESIDINFSFFFYKF